MSDEIRISAVAFKEGDAWVIQGIEYDIAAYADTMSALNNAFSRAVIENCVITERLGRQPLEGIKPAPEHFRTMFEHAEIELRNVRDLEEMSPSKPSISVRVVEQNNAA